MSLVNAPPRKQACVLLFLIFIKGREITFLGGLDWTVLVGKEIIGKSSEREGGGEEVAGVLDAGVPFPPDQHE